MNIAKLSLAAAVAFGLTACSDEPKEVKIETDVQKFSYAMGMDVGTSLKGLGTEIDSMDGRMHKIVAGYSTNKQGCGQIQQGSRDVGQGL